jgi:tRNA1(Val) A37 N6-methylase TrmN6
MDRQRTLGACGATGDETLEAVVEDLETLFRKAGFTGETAYGVLCDLLVAKAYHERKGSGGILSAADEGSVSGAVEDALATALDRDGTTAFSDGLPELPEARLREAVATLDGIDLDRVGTDVFGFFYGRFFSDVFRGESGKFFTPRQVVSAMVELGAPAAGEAVCDPACGSGGFLVHVARGLDGVGRILGNDNDLILAETAEANLFVAGSEEYRVENADLFSGAFLERHRESQDLILANPPFSLEYDLDGVWSGFEHFDGAETAVSDYLFLEAARHLLKPGGRLVSLFPTSMITNGDNERFREMLRADWSELACVTLPEGVFYPYSGTAAQACILLLVKDRDGPYHQHPSLKVNVTEVGYDTSRKTYTPTPGNDFDRLFESQAYAAFEDVRSDVLGGER